MKSGFPGGILSAVQRIKRLIDSYAARESSVRKSRICDVQD
jgi:hypothetical protein